MCPLVKDKQEMIESIMIKNIKNTNSERGFTLIEASIVIVIMSFVLTPLFKAIVIQQQQQEQKIEEVGNERAIAALALFFRQNGRYPCPADPTIAVGAANFGVERPAGCAGGNVNITGGVARGDLPVNTLNLPFDTTINIHGWKQQYAVTITETATPLTGAGAIIVNDAAGAPIGAANQIFVIINPGQDGKGARSAAGTLSPTACAAAQGLDFENCDADVIYLDRELNKIADNTYYDDVLSYTLVRQQSTLWVATPSGAGGIDIVNRNTGNVGIGVAAPTSKMQVVGDVRVQGGSVNADQNITAGTNITSTTGNIIAADGNLTVSDPGGTGNGTIDADGDITAGAAVRATNFTYTP